MRLDVARLSAAGILVFLLAASQVWAYWPTLHEMERTWAQNPRYSHGYLVPLFSAYLLWSRRNERPTQSTFQWLGLLCLVTAALVRCLGAYFYFDWLDGLSFLLSLAGLWTLVFGKEGLSWAWPSLAFLIFMVPLPYSVEVAVGAPLQRISTEVSTYGLQVFGLPAFSSGELIVIGDFRMGIVDACNGLGMLYMFLACSVAAAFMTWRPALDRALLILSAIPIALFANASRIMATGLLHETFGERMSAVVYHDLAGWLMLLLALAILYGECQLIKVIFVETTDPETASVSPAEDAIVAAEQLPPIETRSLLIPLCLAILLVISSGISYGRWTDRWRVSPTLTLAVSRLEQLPTTIGAWKGRTQAVDLRAMDAASIQGIVSRSYENSRTGEAITLVLVCGRPGPVSVHTPEICYPGAGYKIVQPQPVRITLDPDPRTSSAEFLAADFENRRALPADNLRIYWAWNADGVWRAPDSPRLVFATRPVLYKLYLVSRTTPDPEFSMQGSTKEFLQQLLPELDSLMFPKGTTSMRRPAEISKG
jgi:exosortase